MKDMRVGGAAQRKDKEKAAEPETVSEAEDEDEDEDADEMDYAHARNEEEDSDDETDTLNSRYAQALRDTGAADAEDMSFARYTQAAKFG
jgi:hypothetical protein